MQQDGGHPLDNPIWHALGGPHAALAATNGLVRRYGSEFAPFAAWERRTPAGLAALVESLPPGGGAALVTTEPVGDLNSLDVIDVMPVLQMVAADLVPFAAKSKMVPLRTADVPAMQGLVELTHPGPFAVRTIEMGRYVGIVDDGKLMAMAGERMRLDGFTEVSAVCTHPDYRGRGYAKALVSAIAGAIAARGATPFLHVLPENGAAIHTYETLGFAVRRELTFTVFRRPEAS